MTIVVNGKALEPMRFERSLRQMCETIYKGRDTGAVFPAERTIVVPTSGAETGEKAETVDKGEPVVKAESAGK